MKIPGSRTGEKVVITADWKKSSFQTPKPFLSFQARPPIAYRPACHFVALPPMLPVIIGLEQACRMHAVCTAGAALPPSFTAPPESSVVRQLPAP